MLTLLRTFLFIAIGWYVIKWVVKWLSGGATGAGSEKNSRKTETYDTLTDQKIDDADYEDL